MSTPVLNVQGISKRFGGLQALSDVGMRIEPGQVYGLIGPNGAGKTTFFNLISGGLQPDSGNILLAGENMVGLSRNAIVHKGIGRAFQVAKLFKSLFQMSI